MAWMRCTGNPGGSLKVHTASGQIAAFETNMADVLQEVKCSINPIQNGTPWIDSNEVNKEPYIKRAVAGTASRIGNHLYDKLVGGSFAFNQLVQNGNFISTSGWDKSRGNISANNNILTYTVTEVGGDTNANRIFTNINKSANHKVLTTFDMLSEVNAFAKFRLATSNVSSNEYSVTANTWITINTILNASADNETLWLGLGQMNAQVGDTVQVKNAMLIDLTAMFGSTIADYIYGLEQATAGAGVAFFKALFPNDYYAYNAGELMSVKATAHIMRDASNNVIGNYPLDSNLELRGVPVLVNNKLEYDGDTYEASGVVTRKYGVINLGDITWTYQGEGSDGGYVFGASQAFLRADNAKGISTMPVVNQGSWRNTAIGTINIGHSSVTIFATSATITNPTEFKTSVNGVYLVYEKATPTTEQASPFTNPQVCDENGTEEYTDSRAVAIPVGHETYQANICEITGFDELNVVQSGINLWDGEWELGSVNDDGTLDNSTWALNNRIRSKNYTKVLSETAYYFVWTSEPTNAVRIYFYDNNKTFISYYQINFSAPHTFTTPSNCAYILWRSAGSNSVTTFNNDISINYPSSDHDYHSYTGKLIRLEFDDTVYLAEVSCLNGVWKLTSKYARDKINDLAISTGSYESVNYFIYNQPLKKVGGYNIISDIFVTSSASGVPTMPNNSILGSSSNSYVFIRADEFTTVSELKNAVGNNYIYYELATPIEITLDEPEQFETLLGVNNVWHDGNGDTEVKYLEVVRN